jgi:hypothetical protein
VCDSDILARGRPTPKGGFGAIRCDIPEIRNGLWNATDCERGYSGWIQQFDNGFMIRTDYNATFVFYDTAGWEQHKATGLQLKTRCLCAQARTIRTTGQCLVFLVVCSGRAAINPLQGLRSESVVRQPSKVALELRTVELPVCATAAEAWDGFAWTNFPDILYTSLRKDDLPTARRLPFSNGPVSASAIDRR